MKRRTLLATTGTLAAAGLLWWQRNTLAQTLITAGEANTTSPLTPSSLDTPECTLTPEQVEGPFFFKAPMRQNLVEDRQGLALNLQLQVVRNDGCSPMSGAYVEIWHCDAQGIYSGYPDNLGRRPFDTLLYMAANGSDGHVPPENTGTFLRGAQVTDTAGMVQFDTIFPGWYAPRAPHIHVKVFVEGQSYLTTQLYFDDAYSHDIYSNHSLYAPYGTTPYKNTNDTLLRDGTGLLLQPQKLAGTLSTSARLVLS